MWKNINKGIRTFWPGVRVWHDTHVVVTMMWFSPVARPPPHPAATVCACARVYTSIAVIIWRVEKHLHTKESIILLRSPLTFHLRVRRTCDYNILLLLYVWRSRKTVEKYRASLTDGTAAYRSTWVGGGSGVCDVATRLGGRRRQWVLAVRCVGVRRYRELLAAVCFWINITLNLLVFFPNFMFLFLFIFCFQRGDLDTFWPDTTFNLLHPRMTTVAKFDQHFWCC